MRKLVIILILNIIALMSFIILSNNNSSLKEKIGLLDSKIEKPISHQDLSNLEREVTILQSEFSGLVNIFDPALKKEKFPDEGVFFAQKIDSIEKRLIKKAEAKGLPPARIEIPRKIPSQQEAPYLISQIEVLEKAVDLGLKAGLDFTLIKILEPLPEQKDSLIKKIGTELDFTAQGPKVSQYIVLLSEFTPLLTIESLMPTKDDSSSYKIRLTKLLIDKKARDLIPKGTLPKEYRRSISLAEDLKEQFLNNRIFKEVKVKEVAPSLEPKEAMPFKPQRFFYRGIGNLKGKKVAAVEDVLNDEVLFLGIDDKLGSFGVEYFQEDTLILIDRNTGKKLILKRGE